MCICYPLFDRLSSAFRKEFWQGPEEATAREEITEKGRQKAAKTERFPQRRLRSSVHCAEGPSVR